MEMLKSDFTPYALWRFEITAHAPTFEELRSIAQTALERITNAENWRLVDIATSGGSANSPPSGYSILLKVPESTKIAALRKEADEREAALLAGGPGD